MSALIARSVEVTLQHIVEYNSRHSTATKEHKGTEDQQCDKQGRKDTINGETQERVEGTDSPFLDGEEFSLQKKKKKKRKRDSFNQSECVKRGNRQGREDTTGEIQARVQGQTRHFIHCFT